MFFRQFLDRRTSSLSYLLVCPQSGKALMIDPVLDDLGLYLGVLEEMSWSLETVLETHLHADHFSAAGALRYQTNARVGVGDLRIASADFRLADGDSIPVGSLLLQAIATPGHTASCLSYFCQDRLFTGDSLLIGDCADIAEPGADAGRLFDSITRKLLRFPDETLLYPGHALQGRQVSCVAEARRNNPLLAGGSRDEFISHLSARSSGLPARATDIIAANSNFG